MLMGLPVVWGLFAPSHTQGPANLGSPAGPWHPQGCQARGDRDFTEQEPREQREMPDHWEKGRGWGCMDAARPGSRTFLSSVGTQWHPHAMAGRSPKPGRSWDLFSGRAVPRMSGAALLGAAHPTSPCACSPFPEPPWVLRSPGVQGLLSPLCSPQDDALCSLWPGVVGAGDAVPELCSR